MPIKKPPATKTAPVKAVAVKKAVRSTQAIVSNKSKDPGIKAWSLSRLRDYTMCAFFAKCKYVDKLGNPENAAMARGNTIHKNAENYVNGTIKLKDLMPEFAAFRDDLDVMREEYKKGQVKVELELALDSKWNPVSWFAKEAWLRIKFDALRTAASPWRVIDYKTGKLDANGEKYDDTLELYAVGALALNRKLPKAIGELWFLDHDQIIERPSGILLRKDFDGGKLTKDWERRVKPMLSDVRFAPRPGRQCGWCDFSKAKGGPCQF